MAVKQQRDDERSRILLVDEHAIVRQGLTQLINQEDDLVVCGEAESISAALRLAPTARPHLVLLDISLRGGGGVEPVKQLRETQPKVPVLVLSSFDEQIYAERVLRAGARGYLMKHETAIIVMNAIRRCLKGEIYVSEKMASEILHRLAGERPTTRWADISDLSDRELEIFQFLGKGMRVREIAEKLYLSTKTIEAHREHIKLKLNLKSSADLLRYAIHVLKEA